MKFCEKCGAQMEDNMAFCMNCGAKVEGVAGAAPAADGAVAKKSPAKLIGLAVAAVAVILVVVLAFSIFGGGYKSAVKSFTNVVYKGKTKQTEKLAPEDVWDYIDEKYDVDADDVADYIEDMYEDEIDELEDELGKNIKISYKIEGTKKLEKREIKKINKALEEKYDMDDDSVKTAYKVEVDFKYKGKEDYDSNETFITAAKIGGKWYLLSYYEYENDDGDEEVEVSFAVDSYARAAAAKNNASDDYDDYDEDYDY